MGNRKSRNKYFTSFCMVLLTTVLISGLTGCQIVEPEKRAYPLVVGIDWQQEQYQIYLGMAQLAVSTGQGKESGDEQKGDEEGALLLTGASREEIMEIYNQTQELYLDPGHVQGVFCRTQSKWCMCWEKWKKKSALETVLMYLRQKT